MKSFALFIINILSFLTIVRLNEGGSSDTSGKKELAKLTKFYEKIQIYKKLGDKPVFVNGNKTTIHSFLESRQPENSNEYSKLTKQDIHEFSHLLNTVVSCEYSYFSYYIVRLIQNLNNKKKQSEEEMVDDCYKYRQLIQKQLSSMLLTLAGLAKYMKNATFKNNDVLTILLSWHMDIRGNLIKSIGYINYNTIEKKVSDNFKWRKLTLYQIAQYLKQFNLNNCQTAQEYDNFKNKVDKQLSNLKSNKLIKDGFQTRCNELKPLLYDQFLSNNDQTELFVLTPSSDHFDNLKSIISKEVTLEIVNGYWDRRRGLCMTSDYNTLMEDEVLDIKSVLMFERTVLQLITTIIIEYMINFLNDLVKKKDKAESRRVCDEMVIKLDNYIQLFEDNNQPSYLINIMSVIKADLWVQCFYMKSFDVNKSKIENYIKTLEKNRIDESFSNDISKFESFMQSLSKIVICVILHPSISNIFWDRLYFATTKISEYVTDLKPLHKMYKGVKKNVNVNDLCAKIVFFSSKTLIPLNDAIKNSYNILNCGDEKRKKVYFYDLNGLYRSSKNDIRDIIFKYKDNGFKWKQLFLTLIYNMTSDENFVVYESFDEHSLRELEKMADLIRDCVEINRQEFCESVPQNEIDIITILKTTEKNSPSQSSDLDTNEDYSKLLIYKNFYHSVFAFVDSLERVAITIGVHDSLRLYWNNDEKTLAEVHGGYKNFYSIGFLQDHFDYLRFFARWFIALVFSKLKTIVSLVFDDNAYDHKKTAPLLTELQLAFDDCQSLPLYIPNSVKQTLDVFVQVVSEYRGINKDGLKRYNTFLDQELKKLGVVTKFTFIVFCNYYELMTELKTIIVEFKDTFKKYETTIREHENSILVRVDVFEMMLV